MPTPAQAGERCSLDRGGWLQLGAEIDKKQRDMPAETAAAVARSLRTPRISSCKKVRFGWGTWTRTKIDGVRGSRSSFIKN